MNTPLRWLLVLALPLAAGCATARRGGPTAPPPGLTAEQREGEVAFFRHCHSCHPNGEAGLGPAIHNKPLPAAVLRLQIRNGLGAMPAFPDEVLADADVDRIIDYLQAMRRAEPGKTE